MFVDVLISKYGTSNSRASNRWDPIVSHATRQAITWEFWINYESYASDCHVLEIEKDKDELHMILEGFQDMRGNQYFDEILNLNARTIALFGFSISCVSF